MSDDDPIIELPGEAMLPEVPAEAPVEAADVVQQIEPWSGHRSAILRRSQVEQIACSLTHADYARLVKEYGADALVLE